MAQEELNWEKGQIIGKLKVAIQDGIINVKGL